MKKGGFIKDALILFAITLILGACLGGVYGITEQPIAVAKQQAKEEAYRAVLPAAASFQSDDLTAQLEQANAAIAELGYGKVTVGECVNGLDAGGSLVGHVVTATSKDGYGGEITVSVGLDAQGAVTGIEFLTIAETAGLGMNAKEPEWKSQYAGENVDSFSVTKSGAAADGEINAISGATITSNAVTGAVNGAVYFAKNCLPQ